MQDDHMQTSFDNGQTKKRKFEDNENQDQHSAEPITSNQLTTKMHFKKKLVRKFLKGKSSSKYCFVFRKCTNIKSKATFVI